jgi:hypothetical protein
MISTYDYFLFSFDPCLYHIDSLTSRLFLNLRSAAYDTPGNVQTQLNTLILSGNRQDRLREGISGQAPRPAHPDSTSLQIFTPHSIEWTSVGGPKQLFGQDVLGTKDVERPGGGDVELQPRGRLTSMPHGTP